MTHGFPIARQMEKWWTTHALKHDDPDWKGWLETFDSLWEEKQKEFLSEHSNVIDGKPVFGMSKASGCTRESALRLLLSPTSDFSGSTLFTFWIGHSVEVAALATLIMCGYPLIGTQTVSTLGNVMQSTSDGDTVVLGKPTLVSVKSMAYKMSGFQKGKWVRRGFPELPFEGVAKSQPSWYAQIQAELAGRALQQGLVIAVSKDVMKVFEGDSYLGEKGNGSLTFYTELIKAEPEMAVDILDIHTKQMEYVEKGEPGPALYMVSDGSYKELQLASIPTSGSIWGGPNQKITGKFNPCGGCRLVEACLTYKEQGL